MHRLAGADSLFIFNENRARHQHTLKIAVVDPAGADMPVTYDALRDQIREALPLLEPFRWRLVRVPFDLGHPYWIDAPDLDLDYHVQRVAVPAPGGPREFAEVISRIASVGLERDRPLWQVWFVEGLADGQVAYVTEGAPLARRRHGERTVARGWPSRSGPITRRWERAPSSSPNRHPAWWRLLGLGIADVMRMLVALPFLLLRTALAARRGRAHARRAKRCRERNPSRVRTRASTSPSRRIAGSPTRSSISAEIKKVGHAFGASVNDVLLAMAAGALRTYLQAHGELPDASLTAAVPVSVRKPDEERNVGQSHHDVVRHAGDRTSRIRRSVCRRSRAAREPRARRSRPRIPSCSTRGPSIGGCSGSSRSGVPKVARPFIGRPSYNAIVSSVPGPRVPLYRHGARLVHMISMGPLVEGIGVNFTGWSYAGEMAVAVMACREHAPDIWDLADALRTSLDELVAAAEAQRTGAAPA